jgi:hypothetical protein
MVARPLTDPEQALAPAFGYLATLNRELAAIEWLIDNDAEEQP